jgi:hypothetical protein
MWKHGKRKPSEAELERIAAVEELGLSLIDLKAWRMIDEFSLEQLEAAVTEAKKLKAEQKEASTNEDL